MTKLSHTLTTLALAALLAALTLTASAQAHTPHTSPPLPPLAWVDYTVPEGTEGAVRLMWAAQHDNFREGFAEYGTFSCTLDGAPTTICDNPTQEFQCSPPGVEGGRGLCWSSLVPLSAFPAGTSTWAITETAPDGSTSAPAKVAITNRYPAKLKVLRASIRDGKLDVLAPISKRANGDKVRVELHAAGRKYRFTEKVADGRLRFRQRIPAAQARLGTGILTITYAGNSQVRPAVARQRAANSKAVLETSRPEIRAGVLYASGTVSKRARGVVRTALGYVRDDGSYEVFEAQAKIKNGKWALSETGREGGSSDGEYDGVTVPEAAGAGGYATVQFTGYFPERMRGEMVGYQVFAGGE